MRLSYRLLAIGSAVLGVSAAHAQLNIIINPDATLAANAPALAAFQRAASNWATKFSDPITININAGMANLGGSVIGSTSSFLLSGGYDLIRNQIVADAADEAGNAIVASLPTAAGFPLTPD